MNGPIRKVVYALLAGLGLLLLATTYIQSVAADAYRTHPGNSRLLLTQAEKERGAIVDRNGVLLATSEATSSTERSFTRKYPLGELTAHPVGYSTVLFGEAGVEAAFSDRLRSRQDLAISDLLTALFGGDLRPQSLRLSLDNALQQLASEQLGERRGAIVALAPTTGEVLAWVSHPSFDPTRVPDPAYKSALAEDPTAPLVDRARSLTYPPASTFKLIVAAEAIESGLATPDTLLPDSPSLALPGTSAVLQNAGGERCSSGQEVTLAVALTRSCNVPFASLAMQLGAEALMERAELFGFNLPIPFDLSVLESRFPDYTSDLAALAGAGIGERDVRATPLLMAMVAAAIANDGELLRPYIIDAVFDADGGPVFRSEPESLGRAIAPSTAEDLTQMMIDVVESGTGTRAGIRGIEVAGKTGTSEAGDSPPAWFIGFAPASEPMIALAIVVEADGDAGSGGTLAAPIARELFEYWLLER